MSKRVITEKAKTPREALPAGPANTAGTHANNENPHVRKANNDGKALKKKGKKATAEMVTTTETGDWARIRRPAGPHNVMNKVSVAV